MNDLSSLGPLHPVHGHDLLRRLQNYTGTKQHHRDSELLISATAELSRVIQLCEQLHYSILRQPELEPIRKKLREVWQGPAS